MPGGFIERMERIADHLGDGWVIEELAVEPGQVGATVQYVHDSERRVRWTAGPDGQQVTLQGTDGCAQTWLNMDTVHVSRAADAIQDCAWFVEQDLPLLDPSVTATAETPVNPIDPFDTEGELQAPSLDTDVENGAVGQPRVDVALSDSGTLSDSGVLSDGREHPDERPVFHYHHKKFKS